MKLIFTFLFFCFHIMSYAQQNSFVVKDFTFFTKKIKIKNQWDNNDELVKVYILKHTVKKLILEYYAYKNEGEDCNNSFWYTGKLNVLNDSIIITTHHFQKTKLDPIEEWSKKIYKVNNNGFINLVYKKVKYYNETEWKNN